jgi:hypothetical protein
MGHSAGPSPKSKPDEFRWRRARRACGRSSCARLSRGHWSLPSLCCWRFISDHVSVLWRARSSSTAWRTTCSDPTTRSCGSSSRARRSVRSGWTERWPSPRLRAASRPASQRRRFPRVHLAGADAAPPYSPGAWPAATSARASLRPTTPKTCNSRGAGRRQPPIGLVARPALRSTRGRRRRHQTARADQLFAKLGHRSVVDRVAV